MADAPAIDHEAALLHHGCRLLGIGGPASPVDPDDPFVDERGIRFAGHAIDSLDLVELVGAVEEDLGLDLLDGGVFDEINSLRRLAAHIRAHATDGGARYVATWGRTG